MELGDEPGKYRNDLGHLDGKRGYEFLGLLPGEDSIPNVFFIIGEEITVHSSRRYGIVEAFEVMAIWAKNMDWMSIASYINLGIVAQLVQKIFKERSSYPPQETYPLASTITCHCRAMSVSTPVVNGNIKKWSLAILMIMK